MDTTIPDDREAMRLMAHLASVQEVHELPLELRVARAYGHLTQAVTDFLGADGGAAFALSDLRWAQLRAHVYAMTDDEYRALKLEAQDPWPSADDVEHGDRADAEFEGAF